jgi:hypothetical protein
MEENHFGTQIDHTLINGLSTSRQKFPTSRKIPFFLKIFCLSKVFCYIDHLKKWLRDHRTHPYPSNQEKIELAKQSLITYDQVTTWFNNARAILRRHQEKLRHSFDDNESLHEDKNHLDCNHKISSKSKKQIYF